MFVCPDLVSPHLRYCPTYDTVYMLATNWASPLSPKVKTFLMLFGFTKDSGIWGEGRFLCSANERNQWYFNMLLLVLLEP